MRNYRDILESRSELLARCEIDLDYRAEVLQRCAEDTLFWFDNFAFTFDPRREVSQLPFIPYDGKQTKYIEHLDSLLERPRDTFVDKPRDVGATALTMNWALKHWLFDEYFNARIGSRKEDYVDRPGDPDTLFFKIDYTMQRLPKWMLPRGWNENLNRTYMKLTRPDSSNSIVGESANAQFARGGRQTIVIFDELGFWNNARSAWESAGDVTKTRLAMTTPPDTGRNSFAYKLVAGQSGKVEKFEFIYSDIPHKTEEWIAEQRTRRSKEEFEREILKSYSGSVRNKVYATDFLAQVKVGSYPYNPNLPLYASWDFGYKDPTSIIWFQKDFKTNYVYVVDSYEKNLKPIDFFAPFFTGNIVSGLHEYDEEDIKIIERHRNWRKDITHFGDPSGKNVNQINQSSLIAELRKHGIYVQSKAAKEHRVYWEKTILLFRRLHVDDRNDYFVDCIMGARYPERLENSQATTAVEKPIHDDTSHMRTALEYFADNEPFNSPAEEKFVQTLKKKPEFKPYRPMGGY